MNIAELDDAFERLRSEAIKSAFRRAGLVAIAAVILLIFIVVNSINYDITELLLQYGFPALVIMLLYAWVPLNKYKNRIKNKIFSLILQEYGDDLIFSASTSFRVKNLEKFGIIPSYNSENNHDQLEGTYKGLKLFIIESTLTERQNKQTITKFNGLFVKIDFRKKFIGRTIVRSKWNTQLNIFTGLKRVELEDPEFEKYFRTYSTDQIEARYLLTVSFMVRLLELRDYFGKAAVEASFLDQELLLKIPSRVTWFEPGSIFKKADTVQIVADLKEELEILFGIIDILKLNQNIGL